MMRAKVSFAIDQVLYNRVSCRVVIEFEGGYDKNSALYCAPPFKIQDSEDFLKMLQV
jgi:hypothetical protein